MANTNSAKKMVRKIAARTEAFRARTGQIPKTILLQNHGVIALGSTHTDVMAALDMAEKAARVFVGATALGGPVFLWLLLRRNAVWR